MSRRQVGNNVRNGNLSKLVAEYVRMYEGRLQASLRRFRDMPSLTEAIQTAGRARKKDGKCEDHQRRVGIRVLSEFERRLQRRRAAIGRCRSFAELHDLIKASRIPGVGRLTVYDTATRIGAHMGLAPEEVYLHAGARVGARALGLDFRSKRLDPRSLPPAVQALKPGSVENFLRIFKDRFRGSTRMFCAAAGRIRRGGGC